MSAFEFSLYIIERFDPEVKDTIGISILHFLIQFCDQFKACTEMNSNFNMRRVSLIRYKIVPNFFNGNS